jgi:hypothetical protein
MKKTKEKKQFRLYDIYRYAATGEMSNIIGILDYECNVTATTLTVRFEDHTGQFKHGVSCNYFAKNEFELKQIVKEINQRLGNCLKPGRRKRRYN